MSSDDSDSDFDKEAEREKLREKYERDQKDRENTQRMSELLLQGATMTGKHCGNCGDPIFRYDGQEFCPTCQREVAGGEAAEQASEQNATDADQHAAEDDRHAGQAARTDASEGGAATDRSADSDDEPRVEIDDVRVADRHSDPNRRRPPSRQDGERRDAGTPHAHDSAPHGRDSPANRGSAPGRDSPARSPDGPSGDLGAARASLVRTLNDLARRAEETGDVARSRELLAATREAAEALAALDRTDR